MLQHITYYIKTEELTPPVGKVFKWAAKTTIDIAGLKNIPEDYLDIYMRGLRGEVYGITKDEAVDTLKNKIEKSIEENGRDARIKVLV